MTEYLVYLSYLFLHLDLSIYYFLNAYFFICIFYINRWIFKLSLWYVSIYVKDYTYFIIPSIIHSCSPAIIILSYIIMWDYLFTFLAYCNLNHFYLLPIDYNYILYIINSLSMISGFFLSIFNFFLSIINFFLLIINFFLLIINFFSLIINFFFLIINFSLLIINFLS